VARDEVPGCPYRRARCVTCGIISPRVGRARELHCLGRRPLLDDLDSMGTVQPTWISLCEFLSRRLRQDLQLTVVVKPIWSRR
jgi:hypothetical protein